MVRHITKLAMLTLTLVGLSALIVPGQPVEAQTEGAGRGLWINSFPIGVFEDGNMVGGTQQFEAMLANLQARGLDSVMFTNNRVERHAPLLAVSDRLGMNVYMTPAWDLYRNWWPAEFPATIERAREVARPVVEQFGQHPSFKGYIVKDEPSLADRQKVALLTRAFQEIDPRRPTTPILIGVGRVEPIFAAAQPDIMLINVYPTGERNPPCDFTMTGYGYTQYDFVTYIRTVTRDRPPETPLWIILQTHSFGSGGPFALRSPTPSEVRMQHWMAIGEGATGIFWFIYSSQQGWIGLVDNPALFREVEVNARRTLPLRQLLIGLRKVEDRFQAIGSQRPYISTLADRTTDRSYAVVVNRDCQNAQPITLRSDTLSGGLMDVESNRFYPLGATITIAPGDGRIFRHVDQLYFPLVISPKTITAQLQIPDNYDHRNTTSTCQRPGADCAMDLPAADRRCRGAYRLR